MSDDRAKRSRDGRPPSVETRRRRRSGSRERRSERSSSGSSRRHRRRRQRPRSVSRSESSERRRTKKLSDRELRTLRDAIIEEKFGYSDAANPFGDVNLSSPFVWEKKEKLVRAASGRSRKLERDAYLEQTARKIREIEAVRKRREQREEEERLLEEQQAILARERELEHYEEWAAKEEAFHRDMAQRRAEIRIKEGRAKTSDLLVKSLRVLDGDTFDDLTLVSVPPHELFASLSPEDAKTLLNDIQTHCEICRFTADLDATDNTTVNWARAAEGSEGAWQGLSAQQLKRHRQFWEAMRIIGDDYLLKQQQAAEAGLGHRDVVTGLATAALEDLRRLLSQRTEQQLEDMEAAVTQKLRKIRSDPNSQEDPAYWDAVAELVPYYKAVATCRAVVEQAQARAGNIRSERERYDQDRRRRTGAIAAAVVPEEEAETPEDREPKKQVPSGTSYCPVLIPLSKFDGSAVTILTLDEFHETREALRRKLVEDRRQRVGKRAIRQLQAAKEVPDTRHGESAAAINLYEKFVQQEQLSMEEDEFILTPAYEVPVPLQAPTAGSQAPDWESLYRPRKPRFFNRVKTGYEWSKYNQTHYDRDNPPPKAVQGYKFNIFYPDLIDTSVAPSWKLLPSDSPDTVLIQFHGGPPYEDIRFRIINREWDLHPRSGFKNCFDRGILQLHFNFKRYRYRR